MAVLIMVICTMANHMGLVHEVEKLLGRRLPIINCCKCLTFWLSLIYLITMRENLIIALALGFLLSYAAVWFELLLGVIDEVYENIYKKTYPE